MSAECLFTHSFIFIRDAGFIKAHNYYDTHLKNMFYDIYVIFGTYQHFIIIYRLFTVYSNIVSILQYFLQHV